MLIYQKIHNVMGKVCFITKDGQIGFGNNIFKVVTYDRILSTMRQHLLDEGIIIIPNQIDRGIYTEGLTKNGGKKFRYDAIYDIKFICVEDGSEVVSRIEVSAEGSDDKQPSKAVTIATKNAILKVFSLESGDEVNNEIANKVNDKQFAMLKGLVQNREVDLEEFLNYYNATTLADISQAYYQHAVDALQKKKSKGK